MVKTPQDPKVSAQENTSALPRLTTEKQRPPTPLPRHSSIPLEPIPLRIHAIRDAAITSTHQGERASIETFDRLTKKQQAHAHLGLGTASVELTTLPGQTGIITLSVNKDDQPSLKSILEELNLSLPLGQATVRPAISQTITTQHLIAHPNNAFAISRRATESGLPVQIRTAPNQQDTEGKTTSIYAIKFGGEISVIHSTLHNHLPDNDIAIDAGSFEIMKSDATQSVDPAQENLPTKPWDNTCATQRNAINASKTNTEIPARVFGECTYLIIDPNLLLTNNGKSAAALETLAEEIATIATSEDFFLTNDIAGNIVIIGLKQRAGGRLSLLAKNIATATKKQANIFYSSGQVSKDSNGLLISGYPNTEFLNHWRTRGTKQKLIRASRPAIERLKTSRHGTTARIETEEDPSLADTVILKEIVPEANLKVGGGPDRLIGCEKELKQLLDLTKPSSKTKLTILKGKAGQGKSRLLAEMAEQKPSSTVEISIDSAGENVRGQGILTFAEQLNQFIHQNLDPTNIEANVHLKNLEHFCNQPESKKLNNIHENPSNITNYCFHALEELEKINGKFTLILDDAHHLDRTSDKPLMKMMERFLSRPKSNSNAIIAMRPEERYQSLAQRELEQNINRQFKNTGLMGIGGLFLGSAVNPVVTINLDKDPETQRPVLDLKNPKIAEEYIFHMLPEETRTKNDGGNKTLSDNWHTYLAEKCNTPFELTSLMNIILSDPGKHLLVGDDFIALTQAAKEELKSIRNAEDLVQFHEDKIRKLPIQCRTVLECMALLGTGVSQEQFEKIAREIGGVTDPTSVLEELNIDGYITPKGTTRDPQGKKSSQYRLMHDTIRDTILSLMEERAGESRENLAWKLYQQFATHESNVSPDRLFSLIHYASYGKKLTAGAFWNDYAATASIALNVAARQHSPSSIHQIAMMILDDFDPSSDQPTAVAERLITSSDQARIIEAARAEALITTRPPVETAPTPEASISEIIESSTTTAPDLQKAIAAGKQLAQQFLEQDALAQADQTTLLELAQKVLEIPPSLKELITKALMAVATSSTSLGRFSETHQAIQKLEALHHSETDMAQAYLAGFDAAYVQGDSSKLSLHYQKLANNPSLSAEKKFILEIRTSFKKAGNSSDKLKICLAMFDYQDPSQDIDNRAWINSAEASDPATFATLRRLENRIRFEIERVSIAHSGKYDDDTFMEPGVLSTDQTRLFLGQKRELEALNQQKQTDPELFTPIEELYILDQLAQLYCFLGQYELAEHSFGEIWRLANQMQIPREGGRAAKFKGDAIILRAICSVQAAGIDDAGKVILGKANRLPAQGIQRKEIIRAIEVYGTEGLSYIEGIDSKDFYYKALSIQRMRAIGLLIGTYQSEISSLFDDDGNIKDAAHKESIKKTLMPYLQIAMNDYNYMNAPEVWGDKLARDPGGDFGFDIGTHMGQILEVVNKLGINTKNDGIEIPDLSDKEKHYGLNPAAIENAVKKIQTANSTDNLGETARRLEGLQKLLAIHLRLARDYDELTRIRTLQSTI